MRPAREADLPSIGRLGALLVQTHHEFDRARFIAPSPETPTGYASFLGTQLNKKNIIVLAAEARGDVLGYSYAGLEGYDWMSLRGPAGVLYDIIVDPPQRGKGIGRVLLDATLKRLTDMGATQIVLSTATHNETAQRLFAAAGFRRTMTEMTLDTESKGS